MLENLSHIRLCLLPIVEVRPTHVGGGLVIKNVKICTILTVILISKLRKAAQIYGLKKKRIKLEYVGEKSRKPKLITKNNNNKKKVFIKYKEDNSYLFHLQIHIKNLNYISNIYERLLFRS
jgi:hypothetical protein